MAVTMNYGAAPTYVKLASQTSGAVSTVTFSNIPQGYTDLVLVGVPATAANDVNYYLQFNSDAGSNYSETSIRASTFGGVAATSGRHSSSTIGYVAFTSSTTSSSSSSFSLSSGDNHLRSTSFIWSNSILY